MFLSCLATGNFREVLVLSWGLGLGCCVCGVVAASEVTPTSTFQRTLAVHGVNRLVA